MSDFKRLRGKTIEGRAWRGTITVTIDGEDMELSIRQMTDGEYYDVTNRIDMGELKSIRDVLPTDIVNEYRELQEREELNDGEQKRKEQLEEELAAADTNFVKSISGDTFDAVVDCAKYCVVPDIQDVNDMFMDNEYIAYVEEEYGFRPQTPKDLYDPEKDGKTDEWAGPLKDEMQSIIDQQTGLMSFVIGLMCFIETMGGEEGN